MIKIKLKLSKNKCIQYSLKKKYERLILQYFKSSSFSSKKILEEKIKLIKFTLENLDFEKLRSSYRELSGIKELDVFIIEDNKNIKIKIPQIGNRSKTLNAKSFSCVL